MPSERLLLYRAIETLGDNLLISALAHECSVYGKKTIGVQSQYPELFLNNPDVRYIFFQNEKKFKILNIHLPQRRPQKQFFIGSWRIPKFLLAAKFFKARINARCQAGAAGSMMTQLVRVVGLSEMREPRPWYYPYVHELAEAIPLAQNTIVMQSAGRTSFTPNKEWYPKRWEEVARVLGRNFKIIQIGLPDSPLLPCAVDLRGKTTLRQVGAILAVARLFIGQEGGLMHFARAVDLPSVIVYGGFSAPDKTGYDSFANIFKPIECGPCYLKTLCPYDRECMKLIHPEDILEAAHKMLNEPVQKRHWEISVEKK